MEKRKDILWRIYFVYFLICVLAIAILVRVFTIQLVEGEKWSNEADKLMVALRKIKAIQGNIYADDGHSILATSDLYYEVRMDLAVSPLTDQIFYQNVDSLAWCLSNLFKDRTVGEYSVRLKNARNSKNRFFLIKNKVKYVDLQKLKNFPILRSGRLKGGLIVLEKSKRVRPFNKLAARTIGYNREGLGSSVGIESSYADLLKGSYGLQWQQKIAGNQWIPKNDNYEQKPKDGSDVYTTIDINIQDVAENALEQQLKLHAADHGCVIVMEVKTGYIKAIANLSINNDTKNYYEYYNYAIGSSTEPGSVFKLASVIVALEDNMVQPTDLIQTGNGSYKYYDRTMHDSKHGGHGTISVQRAIEVSSNIGVSRIIYEHYKDNPEAFVNGLKAMGLDNKTGINIKGEGAPLIKDPKNRKTWYGTTLPWMAIGYAVRLTPLQILTFYNAVANDGKMMKPQLVSKITGSDGVQLFPPIVLNPSICSKTTIDKVKPMLEGVVENGTATNLKDANFKIAGKTGTARIAQGVTYVSSKGSKYKYQASFVGYFPADNPKYSCIVVVSAPSKDVYYGNLVAGPIFKEIANKVYANNLRLQKVNLLALDSSIVRFPIAKSGNSQKLLTVYKQLNIPVQSNANQFEWVVTHTLNSGVKFNNIIIKDNTVPNVVGMGLQDALYILENRGLVVKCNGSGTITKQSITKGASFTHGQQIELDLM